MIEDGLLFGSRMHWATGLIITIELFFIIHQAFKCLEKSEDKRRQRYLLLLFLLLIYNSIGSLLPDQNINIPIIGQRLLGYAGRLAVLAYCPFYFYKSFALSALKFHARWGIWLFLVGPFVFLFTGCYTLTNDMNLATTCGIAVFMPYSIISVFAIGTSIYKKYKNRFLGSSKEVVLMFITIVPWGLMVMISTIMEMGQLAELILTNTMFLLFCVFYVKEEFRCIRAQAYDIRLMTDIIEEQDVKISYLESLRKVGTAREKERTEPNSSFLEETTEDIPSKGFDENFFDENCAKYLTNIQAEVVRMANQGLTYKEIAKMRPRDGEEDSIKKLMSSIGKRLGVRGRENILLKLKSKINQLPKNEHDV